MKYLKISGLFLCIFLTVHIARAQQLQWLWGKQGYGAGGENVAGMVCDSLGNIYIAGNFADSVRFGETILNSKGRNDIFLVKYNKEGKVLWAKSAGGTGDDYPGTLSIGADGNLYMAGMVGKDASFDQQSAGEKKQNLFVARYTDEGEAQWVTAWPARAGDYITSIAADSLGNVYCGGYFEKKFSINGQHSAAASGKADAFAACFNPEGQTQWLKSWGGKGNDKITHLHVSGKHLWMTGVCQSSTQIGSQTIATSGNIPAAFILRCTAEGEILHARKLAEGENIHVAKIKPLANGNIVIGGSFSDSLKTGMHNMHSHGNHDIFVTLMDTMGETVWQQQIGSYGFDKIYDIMEHPSSGIVVTGIYSGVLFVGNDTTSLHSRNADLFNLAMNYEGEQQWISTTRGRTEQYPASLAQDAEGNIYVSGAFRDTLKIRQSTLTAPKGKYSVFFAKLHHCGQQNITFSCDTVFTEGTVLPLKVQGSYTSYRWDHGRSTSSTYEVTCGGVYRVSVTDSLGCVYRDSIKVQQAPAVPVIQIRAQAGIRQQLYGISSERSLLVAKLEEEWI